MTTTKRKFVAVTVKPELYEKCKICAKACDMPVTAWVRQVIIEKLQEG